MKTEEWKKQNNTEAGIVKEKYFEETPMRKTAVKEITPEQEIDEINRQVSETEALIEKKEKN